MTPTSQERGYYRFDSLTELLSFCRAYYETLDVSSVREDDELRVRAVLPDGTVVKQLVVHFEGSRVYMVRLG